jgi:signal transduction histidine kinase
VRRSSRSRWQRIADVAIPLVVGLFLVALVGEGSAGRPAPLTILGMLAGAVQGAALWWQRSRPVLVMAIALAGGLVIQLLAPAGVFPFAALVAIGSLAAARPPLVSLPALAAVLGLTALNLLTAPAGDTLFAMAVVVAAWALGEAVRNRRTAIAEAARRAVSEEQARIARELHDVIAHSVSVIVVQAAAADDVFEQRPDQAHAALRSIEAAGATRWESCAGCWPRCGRAPTAGRRIPSPGSTGSGSWWRRCAPPAWRSRCDGRAPTPPTRCRPASTCPPTGSCRRP